MRFSFPRLLWSRAFDYRAHRLRIWNEEFERGVTLAQAGSMALDRLSRGDAEKALAVRVNGELRDVRATVATEDKVEAVTWDGSDDSKRMLWHSSAHLLGDAIEQHFDQRILLCDGPPLLQQGGFFYEFWSRETVSPADFESLGERAMALAGRKRKFERMLLPLDRARELFSYNPFKLEVLDAIAARGENVAVVYRSGDFVDLCRGPHVPNTGRVKWIKCLSASGSTGKLGGADVPLHRVYGISFPTADEGKQWEQHRAEVERRDHRVIGQRQNLLMFNEASPGSAFFLPDGAYVYNRLVEMLRKQYHLRGYQEVITPVLFQQKLWETSGHWEHYKKDMFFVEGEERLGLKPMNCFPVSDHQLLTSEGFLFHHEVAARLAADPEFKLASFDAAHQTVVFERPRRLVYNDCPDGGQVLIEFSGGSGVSVAATPEHNILARRMAESTFSLRHASELEAEGGALHMLALGESGELSEAFVSANGVRRVRSGDVTWCAAMPSGFVVVRRVVRDDNGCVVGASRTTVQGNCPSHCLVFGHTTRSHRELPLRFADFGVLHRNEQSGALTGLTRVRKFQQDDAHIFCREDQLRDELSACLDFLRVVYEKLGFGDEFSIRLATRPTSYVGTLELWDLAESTLKATLESFGRPWTVEEGDGSFYGPKLDILIRDAMGRMHQCGTIQLDFQLPRRFKLAYIGEDGAEHVPVMIHRAILGSGERMFAVLTEHCEGKWAAWLNPRLVALLPVADSHRALAEKVRARLFEAGVRVYVIDDGNTLQKRIRNAQLAHYSYMLVLGDEEEKSDVVAVRYRDQQQIARMPFTEFCALVEAQVKL
jgi:threonyl-tRNA synthetase